MPLNLAFLMRNSIFYFISESRSFEVWRYLYEDMKMPSRFYSLQLVSTNISSTESAVRQ